MAGLPVADAMALDLPANVDLATVDGARTLMAVALHRLAMLPFSERTAHAVAALVQCQQRVIEAHDLETRLARLERDRKVVRTLTVVR